MLLWSGPGDNILMLFTSFVSRLVYTLKVYWWPQKLYIENLPEHNNTQAHIPSSTRVMSSHASGKLIEHSRNNKSEINNNILVLLWKSVWPHEALEKGDPGDLRLHFENHWPIILKETQNYTLNQLYIFPSLLQAQRKLE